MFPKPILLLTSSVGFTHNSDVILLTVIEAYFIMVDLHSAPVLVFVFFFSAKLAVSKRACRFGREFRIVVLTYLSSSTVFCSAVRSCFSTPFSKGSLWVLGLFSSISKSKENNYFYSVLEHCIISFQWDICVSQMLFYHQSLDSSPRTIFSIIHRSTSTIWGDSLFC